MWIAITGFIVMMVGYVLRFITNMDLGMSMTNTVEQNLTILGLILSFSGVITSGIGLIIGGTKADYLPDKVRSSMFIAVALLIGLYLGLTSFMIGFY